MLLLDDDDDDDDDGDESMITALLLVPIADGGMMLSGLTAPTVMIFESLGIVAALATGTIGSILTGSDALGAAIDTGAFSEALGMLGTAAAARGGGGGIVVCSS